MPKAYRHDVESALKEEREELHSAQLRAVLHSVLAGVSGGLAIVMAGLRPPQGDTFLFVTYWVCLVAYTYILMISARRVVECFIDMRDALRNISAFKASLKSDDLL